jgi:hypothetical protein
MKSPNEFFVRVVNADNTWPKSHTNIVMGCNCVHISHYTTVMGPSNYKLSFVIHITQMAELISLHWYVDSWLHSCNGVFEDLFMYSKFVCAPQFYIDILIVTWNMKFIIAQSLIIHLKQLCQTMA